MEADIAECCLRWKSHKQTLISWLDSLLEKECLVDITLAAEGKLIRAHRLVLCACSQYFEELLGNSSNKETIIYLKDVPFTIVKAVVEYMYRGEVNLLGEELNLFLSFGKELKIKGLIENNLTDRTSPEESQASSSVMNLDKEEEHSRIPPLISAKCFEFVAPVSPSTSIWSPREDPLLMTSTKSDPAGMSPPSDLALEGNFMAIDQIGMDTDDLNSDSPAIATYPFDGSFGHPFGNEHLTNNSGQIANDSQVRGRMRSNETRLESSSLSRNAERVAVPSASHTKNSTRKPKNSIKGRTGCSCPNCGRWYMRRESMTRHRNFECGQEPKFKCLLCPKLFKRKDKLKEHETKHHLKDPLLLADQQTAVN